MNKESLISELENFRKRLIGISIELDHDYKFGVERWESWIKLLTSYFDQNLNAYNNKLLSLKDPKGGIVNISEPLNSRFKKRKIDPIDAFLRSLILDIKEGVADLSANEIISHPQTIKSLKSKQLINKAFIVHGHDEATKFRTARFLEKIGFEAIILHEQASNGNSIIEKLEKYTDVGFGIVLYTPDDEGSVKDEQNYKPRARQNVVFEHGLLIGKLGRKQVFPLVTDHKVELPGDISGIVYMSDNGWEIQLAKEIKALGYDIDFNKVI